MVDADRPRLAVRPFARHAHVAAGVDAEARGARGEHLLGDHVGGEALADAAGIESSAGRQAHAVALDRDVAAPGERHCRAALDQLRRTGRRSFLERSAVASGHERGQDRRVEGAAREVPPLHCSLDERPRLR